ncbi:hypothetical protein MG290_14705 (plasmid) [Flavobacterium sp. CBA20B-1]|uniref:hypothetical protein n=1 Tax=unclassified Flavobacterium TaxID=196869 RepID=UPI002224514D|nr:MULTISPECIES: hypothetical protein [unclassified Flavobacterium]WCM43612.1 hypothetical protein MG290_14705 [Flavobacterium sp. CBA20B-1]
MIYDSLDTLPVLTFYKVGSTGNLGLLQNKVKRKDRLSEFDLMHLFTRMQKEFTEILNNLSIKSDDNSRFHLIAIYEYHEAKQKIGFMAIELLKIEVNQDAIDFLESEGFKVDLENTERYYKSLESIFRKLELINSKKKAMISSSPKLKEYVESKLKDPEYLENETSQIIKTLIAFSEILNIQINIQKVSCAEYLVYYDLVSKKIEQEKKNNQTAKND